LQSLCQALILLRNKGLMPPTSLLELFFQLFRCQDKLLRKTLYNYIVQDIKNVNQKHRNMKLNVVSCIFISFAVFIYNDASLILSLLLALFTVRHLARHQVPSRCPLP
jgi:uncharacterized membrane protein YbaN (DUF454 family)